MKKLITLKVGPLKKGLVLVVTIALSAMVAALTVFANPASAWTGGEGCNTYKLVFSATTGVGDTAQIVGFYSNPPSGDYVDAYPNLSTVTVSYLTGTSTAGNFVGSLDGKGGYEFKAAPGVKITQATAWGCNTPAPPTTTTPLISVTPAPVTFVDATCTYLVGQYTVPVTPHITYVDINPVPSGTFDAAVPSTLSIRAVADAGYSAATPNEWKHDFKAATNCSSASPTTTPPTTPPATTTPVVVPVTTPVVTTGTHPLPASARAGQADTSGHLVAGFATGVVALILIAAGGFVLYRRKSEA